jgi:hypothetical protein
VEIEKNITRENKKWKPMTTRYGKSGNCEKFQTISWKSIDDITTHSTAKMANPSKHAGSLLQKYLCRDEIIEATFEKKYGDNFIFVFLCHLLYTLII